MNPTLAAFKRPPLAAAQFVATKFDSAAAKADFGNQLQARHQPEKPSVAEPPRPRPADWAADQASLF